MGGTAKKKYKKNIIFQTKNQLARLGRRPSFSALAPMARWAPTKRLPRSSASARSSTRRRRAEKTGFAGPFKRFLLGEPWWFFDVFLGVPV
jgi:hypothetical protein